jgi:hypothetical protein
MKALIGGVVFGMLLIVIPVGLVAVPPAVSAEPVADTDTTRLYCGITVECAS